jgi:serralysin
MIAGMGQNYGDYVSSTDTVTLTADWKTYTINVSAENGIGGDASRVFFDMGADAGEVYLDNVSLTRPINFAENATGTVYTAAAVDDDGDAIAYSLSGADADLFAIDESTGVITFKAAPNYEAPKDSGADNTYNLTITATDDADPALSSSQDIEVHVTDVNEAPAVTSAVTASIDENSATTDVVYTATASDEDGDDITFSLSGTDAASFELGADSGELTFNASPDHETKDSYSVTITANDGSVDSDAQTVTVSVNDVNEAPVASDIQSAPSAVVEQSYSYDASVLFTDEDDGATLTYSATGLPTGLSIDAATGVISGNAPEDESLTNAITVTASDGKLSDFTEFNLAVVRAPVILSIARTGEDSIALDGEAVTLVVTMSESVTIDGAGTMTLVFDVEGTDWTVTKSLADGEQSSTFTMSPATAPGVVDDNTVTLKSITVDDSTVIGDDSGEAFDPLTVGVVVTNLAIDNADPVFTSGDPESFDENATGTVYTALATDATDVTFTLATSDDGSSFTIDGGVVSFDSAPDYEMKSSYTFTVNAADASGNTSSKTVAVSVNNLNDNAPTVVSDNATSEVTYKSGTVISDSIADWFTDADGDDLTFSLTGDNVGLSVDSSTGAVTGTVTSEGDYSIKVTATDGTNSKSQDVAVTVVDAPTLSSANLDGNTKFDVTSNIVLTASSAVIKGTGNIKIVETGTDNTITIDVASDQVSISDSTITINPTVDLDFGTSYHITVDENAFGINIGEQGLLGSVAVSDETAINFTTVTPSPSSTEDGAASQAMNDAGEMVASYTWFAAEGRGTNPPTDAEVETIAFGDGTVPVALVVTNTSTSAIRALEYNIKVTDFSGEDLIYFDDTSGSLSATDGRDTIFDIVLQSSTIDPEAGVSYSNDELGLLLKTAADGGFPGKIELYFDESVDIGVADNYFALLDSYAGLQTMLGVDDTVYPLYYG